MSDEDPNLEVLRQLNIAMDRNIKIRSAVARAMARAYSIGISNETGQPAALEMGRTVENVTREIMELFAVEGEKE